MTVYIVQKRHWYYNDYYVLEDSSPVQAFESREDAEAFRQQCEEAEWKEWQDLEEIWGKPTDWFQGEEGVKAPGEYALFEIVAAELVP